MSGCVNCVYNTYADDALAYNEALSSALHALESAQIPRSRWPRRIIALDKRERSDSGSKTLDAQHVTNEEMEDAIDAVDSTLKAFLELEGKLKAKKKRPVATNV